MAPRDKKPTRGNRPGHAKRLANMTTDGGFSTINIPDGVELWKPKPGVYKIDVIPYTVGRGNPAASPGDEYFERTYHVYKNLGPNEKTLVAIGPTFGDPDPVLVEFNLRNRSGADWDAIKDLKGKPRQLWLILDHGDIAKGVQLYETSYRTFGEKIDNAIRNADEDEQHKINFDDPDAGATLRITFIDEKIGANTWTKVDSVEFKPRRNGLSDMGLLDHGICLDDIIKRPTAADLTAAMEGVPDTADTDPAPTDPAPTKRRTRGGAMDAVNAVIAEAPAPPKPKPKTRKPAPVVAADDDWDDDEEEAEAPAPPKPKTRKPAPVVAAADDWDDDWED